MDQIVGTQQGDGSVNFKFQQELEYLQVGLGLARDAALPRPGRMTMCGDGLHVFLVPMPLECDDMRWECRCGGKRYEGWLVIVGAQGVMEMFVPDDPIVVANSQDARP